ncbi:unnamed protein product [Phyllotreta striolata]|uniref:Major facilitator superfamily (MFS) profile domain-containing protein n=1 Tax=Phyllotreta striolata TaxID=444603 RepID=A0A9N9XJY9_PHYSR|nr:unnamed protein product [Phyllotreta striolata]
MTEQKSPFFLYLAVLSVNLHSFATVSSLTWSSPSLVILNSNDTSINPLGRPLTNLEESWIISLIALGAVAGNLIAAYVAKKLGPKNALIASAVPFIASYLMLAHATTTYPFFIARFVAGTCAMFSMVIIPGYISEISPDHNRGFFISLTGASISISNLLNYCVGPYLSIKAMAYVVNSTMVLFLLSFVLFVPDSPHRLMTLKRNAKAEKSLRRFRGNEDVAKELDGIRGLLSDRETEKINVFKEMLGSPAALKGLVVCCSLFFVQVVGGYGFIPTYLQTIFEKTGDAIPSTIASIVIGIVQTMATFACSMVIDRLGRKKVLYVSLVGSAVPLVFLGLFFSLKKYNYNTDIIFWMPLAALIAFFVSFSLGVGPIGLIMSGELFTPNFQSTCVSISLMLNSALGFFYILMFPFLIELVGFEALLYFSAVMNLLAIVYVKVCVPETKGKSLEEIQRLLGGQICEKEEVVK